MQKWCCETTNNFLSFGGLLIFRLCNFAFSYKVIMQECDCNSVKITSVEEAVVVTGVGWNAKLGSLGIPHLHAVTGIKISMKTEPLHNTLKNTET